MSVAWFVVLLALFATACYETSVALGLIPLGPEPGDGPPAEKVVLLVGLLALLLGAALAWLTASTAARGGQSMAPLVAPLGAGLMIARFYTPDPYYLPTFRRMSEGGFIPGPWVFALVGLALLVVGLAYFRRSLGLRLMGVLLVLCALTTLFESTGH